MSIVSLTVRLHDGGDLCVPASYDDGTPGNITTDDRTAAIAALQQRLAVRRSPLPTDDFRSITLSEQRANGTRVLRTFALSNAERHALLITPRATRTTPTQAAAPPAPPAATSAEPITPPSPTSTDLPTHLNRTALDRLLRISPADRSPAQNFLIMIARSRSLCSSNTNGVESREGLDRYDSLDQLISQTSNNRREFSSGSPIPVPELTTAQKVQLIRWLERSSIPSGPSYVEGGTRYRSALATEFSDISILIYQANTQSPQASRLSPEGSTQLSSTNGSRSFTERILEPQDIRVLAGLLRGRENHPNQPIRAEEVTRARQYAVAYFRLASYFAHNQLPSLEVTSTHPIESPRSGGTGSGRPSRTSNAHDDGGAF